MNIKKTHYLWIMVLIIITGMLGGCQQRGKSPVVIPTEPAKVSVERLEENVQQLSSLDYSGRRTGEIGEAEAGLLIAQKLKDLSLMPLGNRQSYFQSYPVPKMELNQVDKRAEFFLNGGNSHSFGDNVLAGLISSQRPDEYIVLSAHYDHLGIWQGRLYPGANDNASGVSALLELARVLAAKNDLPYSIIFAFWSGEEMGLLGSKYFVENPTISLAKIKLNINVDSIGLGRDEDFIYWSVGNKELINKLIESLEADSWLDFQEDFTQKHTSDHRSFENQDFAALTVLAKDWLVDNHSPQDLPEKINYSKIKLLTSKIVELLESEEIEQLLETYQ